MLGRRMIQDQVKYGRIDISGFPKALPGEDDYLQPYGVDLTLSQSLLYGDREYLISCPLSPGHSILVQTNERVNLSKEICARVVGRGENMAQGVVLFAAELPPLHNDKVQLLLHNHGQAPFNLTPDMRICTLVFDTVNE